MSKNLLLDGFAECAGFVARQMRGTRVGAVVHVSPNGALRVCRSDRARSVELPDSWLVGSYGYPPRIEWIEDDLIAHARDLQARRADLEDEPEPAKRRYVPRKRKEAA